MDRRQSLAFGAALVTVVLWASAFVGIRSAGESLSPGALALARLAIGVVVLGGFVALRREAFPSGRDLPLIGLCGVLWFGTYNVALNASERHLDAGTAAMLVNVGPIIVAVLAGLLLGEGFPRQLIAGCAVAFLGVAVIGLATSQSGLSTAGTVLALVAAMAYAGGVVIQKVIFAPRLGAADHISLLLRRRGRLPAFRPHARARGRRGGRIGARVGRLPRRAPNRARLYDLGVRARADERRSARRNDVSGAADLDPARLDRPRRVSTGARVRRRRALPARRGARPARLTGSGEDGGVRARRRSNDLVLELAHREHRLGETNVFARTWLPLLDAGGVGLQDGATGAA